MGDTEDATTRGLRTTATVTQRGASSRRAASGPVRPEPEPEPEPGDVIGRYTLLGRLGAGGMGVVFSAHDDRLDRNVAIKVLRGAVTEPGEWSEGRARLLREAQAMAQLSHPHVVEVFDVGTADGALYIAMALVEGLTLRDWLRERARGWREVVEIFTQAARGLAAAHAAGLVHRDFKPGNVLVDADGHARVLDFGLALPTAARGRAGVGPRASESGLLASSSIITDRLTAPVTMAGTVMGTPAYMAPEQHRGGEVGPAGDQFALCVALFEGIYGARPFAGREADELWRAKEKGTLVPAPRGHPAPLALHRVLARGLRARPEDRWPSIDALTSALDELVRPRRRYWVAGVGLAGLVLAGGVASWTRLGGPSDDPACAQARDALQRAWGDSQRAVLRDALQTGDAEYAADTAQRVEQRLDDYSARWLSLHAQICAEEPSDRAGVVARERRLECLQRRGRRMATLVEVLVDTDSDLLLHAAALVQGLPALEGCAAEVPDDDGLVPPDDPATALRVDELRGAFEEAKALVAAGQYERAFALATKMHAQAEVLGYAPLTMHTELMLGETLLLRGELAAAEEHLVHTLHEAEAAGDDALVVSVVTRLVHLTSDRPEESLRWARHGESRLSRIPDNAFVNAMMRLSLGSALGTAGKSDDAVAELLLAVAGWEALVGPDDLQTAAARNNLGIVYYDMGRYEDAIVEYERVLSIRERALGPTHPDVGAVLNNLANAELALGQYERTLALQLRMLAIWRGGLGPDHPNLGAAYGNLGNTARVVGRVSEALAAYERSIAIRERALGSDHPELAVSRINYGATLSEVGRYDDALLELRRARSILERSVGAHPWTALAIANAGTVLAAQGKHEAALEDFVQALERLQTLGLGEHPMVIDVRRTKGESLLALGRLPEARQELEAALVIEARESVAPEESAALWFALAKVLQAQHEDPSRARALVERALSTWRAGPRSMRRQEARAEAWLDRESRASSALPGPP